LPEPVSADLQIHFPRNSIGIGADNGHPKPFFVPFAPLCEKLFPPYFFSHKGAKGTKKHVAIKAVANSMSVRRWLMNAGANGL
jgi:hypothetical protein